VVFRQTVVVVKYGLGRMQIGALSEGIRLANAYSIHPQRLF